MFRVVVLADVFLSYRNLPDRRARVERLAAILEAHGLSVWWDYGLEAGLAYRDQIFAELEAAKVVAPLWCSESVQSEWVLQEATIGKAKLCPARLEAVSPPHEFEPIQAANLTSWSGQPDDDQLQRYILRLATQASAEPQPRQSLLRQMRLLPSFDPLGPKNETSDSTSVSVEKSGALHGHSEIRRTHTDEFLGIEIGKRTTVRPPQIYQTIFAPNGKFILTLGQDRQLRHRDADGAIVYSIPAYCDLMCVSPDSALIAMYGQYLPTVIAKADGEELCRFDYGAADLVFLDNNYIATIDEGELRVWDLRTMKAPDDVALQALPTSAILSTHDSYYIGLGPHLAFNAGVFAKGGKAPYLFWCETSEKWPIPAQGTVKSVSLSRDAKSLLVCDKDIRIFDTVRRRERISIGSVGWEGVVAIFSPDDSLVASVEKESSSTKNRKVTLWDAKKAAPLWTTELPALNLAFSNASDKLAISCSDGQSVLFAISR